MGGGDPEMWKYFIAIEDYRRSGEGGCGKTLLP